MSSFRAFEIKTKLGEIDCTTKFSEQFSRLCMTEDYCDVFFIVDGKRIPAHRVILAARSDFFRTMLFGNNWIESTSSEIPIIAPLEAFQALLHFVYSGKLSLNRLDNNVVLDVLALSNQYNFGELEDSISKYLQEILSIENACPILDSARLFNLKSLINDCHEFMDRNASNILKDDSFFQLSEESLCGLLVRDSFYAPEVTIYKAVATWLKLNPKANVERVFNLVRLPLMDLRHLLEVVRPSGILQSDYILDAIATQNTNEYLNFRGILMKDNENVAVAKYGARTTKGVSPDCLLDGDTRAYDMEKGYTSHTIEENSDNSCIEVELGSIYIINHIKILLWDRDIRSYSYYIDVSANHKTWKRVVDHTQYNCRAWQFLYFPQIAVKYIRLVGTNNSINKVFHCVALEAYFEPNLPTLVRGLVQPASNIATMDKSAAVIDGVSRTRNNLLNGDVKNYDWDSGYTCHQLGSGSILIQLGQPYYLSSCRLLLWDCDDRTYSFYIETSVDQRNWDVIIDKRNVLLKSWQHFTFPPRPIVFFRIVGTYNSVNEIFHCVHFECPSQDPEFLKEGDENETQLVQVKE